MSERVAEKLPLRANVRWFQLAFGAFVGIVGYQLMQHYRGIAPLSDGALVIRMGLTAVGLFIFIIYLQNVYRFGLVPDYALKCRFCNGPVNRYSEFCEHCGADLIAEDKLIHCPKCEVELYEGTKHCPECGALVTKPEKGKGKKGKNRPPEERHTEGWDRPLDAVSPPPWEDR